jgi:hypothetical protein
MDIALPDKTYPVHVEGVDSGVVESEVNLPSDLRLRHVAVEQLLDALQRNNHQSNTMLKNFPGPQFTNFRNKLEFLFD